MADDLLTQAPFLPLEAPKESLIDYSQTLSNQARQNIEQQCHNLPFHAKVVVLPRDFSPGSMKSFDEFCRALAEQWHVTGNRFLLVVDTRGHHVRALCGQELEAQGISSDFLSSSVLKLNFIPKMKKGDLEAAISSSVNAVAARTSEQKTAQSEGQGRIIQRHPYASTVPQSGTSTIYGEHSKPSDGSGFLVFLVVLIGVVLAVIFAKKKLEEKQSQEIYLELKKRLDSLYQKADSIGQASEYLEPARNAELAKEVAIFFNRLGAISSAQTELDRLERSKGLGSALVNVRKLNKMVEMLEGDAAQLEKNVNEATGKIGTSDEAPELLAKKFEREAELAVAAEDQAEQQRLQIQNQQREMDERFRRPSWAFQPSYYQPVVVNDPWSGIRDMFMIMNQMETNRRLSEIADYQRHEDYANHDRYDGSSWNQSSQRSSVGDSAQSSAWGGGDGSADWGSGAGDYGGGGRGDSDSGWGDSGAGGDYGGGGADGGGDW